MTAAEIQSLKLGDKVRLESLGVITMITVNGYFIKWDSGRPAENYAEDELMENQFRKAEI